jgi:hypothetical protein
MDLAANLPAGIDVAPTADLPDPAGGVAGNAPQASSILQIYDALGNQRQVTLDWWRVDTDTWRLSITPAGAGPATPGPRVIDVISAAPSRAAARRRRAPSPRSRRSAAR